MASILKLMLAIMDIKYISMIPNRRIIMKTKLGISTGVFAAITFLVACFGGYTPVLLLVGYVLICESDEWLKKAVLKALGVMLVVSFCVTVINLLPNVFGWINSLLGFFNTNVNFGPINNFLGLFTRAIDIAETCFLLVLGAKALKNETVKVPVVDGLIDKYTK